MTLDYTPVSFMTISSDKKGIPTNAKELFFLYKKRNFLLPGLELPREACNRDMTISLTDAQLLL